MQILMADIEREEPVPGLQDILKKLTPGEERRNTRSHLLLPIPLEEIIFLRNVIFFLWEC